MSAPVIAVTESTDPRSTPAFPIVLVLSGCLSTWLGAAFAVHLFTTAGVWGVLSLRLGWSAVLLLLICRPRLHGHSTRDWGLLGSFGVAMGAMNTSIYHAIDRIPLGTAVTLEVIGPLVLSVAMLRSPRNVLAAGLALLGVALLCGPTFTGLDRLGVCLALLSGCCWAAYILLSARVGQCFPRADGIALAMVVAAIVTLPIGASNVGSRLVDPSLLLPGLGVAALSSAVPYTLELLALRRMRPSTFGLLMSVSPCVAAVAGLAVLDQSLAARQYLGIIIVTIAVGAGTAASTRDRRSMTPVDAAG